MTHHQGLLLPRAPARLQDRYEVGVVSEKAREFEFGYRFLVDEARGAGAGMAERTAWRICRDNRWWSVFGKKRGRAGRRGGRRTARSREPLARPTGR
jgi:hypothetical protein